MNHTAVLLQWNYLVFLLPFGVATLLLILSSLRLGHHRHGGGGGGHRGHAAPAGSGHSHSGGSHSHSAGGAAKIGAHGHSGGHAAKAGHTQSSGHKPPSGGTKNGTRDAGATPLSALLSLLGVGRAPLPLVLEMLCLCFGLSGFLANQVFQPRGENPTLLQALPSLAIALVGGILGGRLSAEVIGRLMPHNETAAISRNALYGLTGRVAFPVSETAGRVLIYDEFGTLHTETCRTPAGVSPIPKGSLVRVADSDGKGNLIVEETLEV